ncbi:MAG: hypothetical protein JKY93_02155 [Gammaproteobacteria bacterium]|nr:hypothetical protein [Gammaproteobacteria bacterium]
MNINDKISKLNKASKGAEFPQSRYLVHGQWTGISQGHTVNCYGFYSEQDAAEYARLLNIKNGWEGSDNKYIVSPNPNLSAG